MAVVQAAENYGNEWGFRWYLQNGIYTSILDWTNSKILSSSAAAAAAKPPSLKKFTDISLKW